MKTNAYTIALDNIHVSESAIEAALAAAKLRATKTASAQAKLRYAAIAASVVLAGAASAAYFGNIAQFKPPVTPSPLSPTAASTNAADATEPKAVKGTTAATEKPLVSADNTDAAVKTESTESVIEHSETTVAQEPASPQQKNQATEAPAAPTDAATEPAPTESPAEQNPLPEVDSERLCADGKLFIAFAATGIEQIDESEAFTDDHLYYIETKFGRYYRIQPPEIKFINLSLDKETPRSDEMVYLYNSDGEIVGQAPVWW